MKTKLLMAIIEMFVKRLSEDNLKKFADGVLDLIENKVEASTNKGRMIASSHLFNAVRSAFNIPDDD